MIITPIYAYYDYKARMKCVTSIVITYMLITPIYAYYRATFKVWGKAYSYKLEKPSNFVGLYTSTHTITIIIIIMIIIFIVIFTVIFIIMIIIVIIITVIFIIILIITCIISTVTIYHSSSLNCAYITIIIGTLLCSCLSSSPLSILTNALSGYRYICCE